MYAEYPRPRDSDSGCLRFFSALLMGMNILLTAAAVAGLAIGLLERSTMEATLKELCLSCHTMFIAYIAVLSVLLGFSLLGFFALCTRNTFLRVMYFIYLFLVFLGAFAISLAYFLVSTNQVNMEANWDKATVSSPQDICSLELQFHCSGWKTLCNTSPVKGTHFLTRQDGLPFLTGGDERTPANNAVPLAVSADPALQVFCPVCSEEDQKEINQYNSTCESVVMGAIKHHMKEVLPIGLSITVIALLGMIVTCLLRREKNRDEYYGGRYYRV
ncbi:uncharacterized protein Tco025E_07169 [Trypanosoma conorhini]|uniref:Uncharacterized protein n=1 Tax=Trypanosoma conorhini TaxID=83891 RepID=A0A422NSG7_9TRYP|nr:uncharacterized protein Tco025E_07169 [Trypanosoma conorhini]RNF08420.1 hypothetical protein Tco025E_07169 [Trypanosoma conorhini]